MSDTPPRSYLIHTLGENETIAFAARELAAYLRRLDDVEVAIHPADAPPAADSSGLTLALLADLGIGTGVDDPTFDDRILVQVSPGLLGVLAGSNPRSVLMAVYRLLHAAGCRWVRPGPDGELVPRCRVGELSVQIDETPTYRYRGMCIEGAVSYENVAENIDWLLKVGFNSYFSEFFVPHTFFDRWYRHLRNPYKEPEQLTVDQVAAFRQQLERELDKRGLIYHSVGHGWTCEPFGIPGLGWDPKQYDLDDDVRSYLAEVNGVRDIWKGIPLNTQLCFSNAEVRRRVVDYAVRHVRENPITSVLHVWLADSANNHCECADCRDTLPADFYLQLLNEMDAAFTESGLDCRIAFIAYLDLLWPPERERLNNPDRFVLLFAPISRSYSRSYDVDTSRVPLAPYERNKLTFPSDITENLAYLARWRELFPGDAFTYEYYFMWDHYLDPAYYETAKIIHQDVQKLKLVGLNGIVSDQTQRAYFPTGFGMTVLARSLWDDSVSLDDVAEGYFSDAFGPDGDLCRAYMARLSALFDPPYLRGDVVDGQEVSDKGDSHTWILGGGQGAISRQAPAKLGQIPALIDDFAPVIERNLASPERCWAQSWAYLAHHAHIARSLALAFKARAEGDVDAAKAQWHAARDYVRRNEDALQPVLDVYEFVRTLGKKFD